MSLVYQFAPIERWPGEPSLETAPSRFRASYTNTLDLLDRELEYLDADEIVVQAHLERSDIRMDGLMRANARPSRPGVILSFESKYGPLSYPCDTFGHWQDNLRAIALALAALRAVDRYGVTRRAEQYQGWQQLPPPGASENMTLSAAQMLLNRVARVPADWSSGLKDVEFESICRMARRNTHPDVGGSAEAFKDVQRAIEIVERSR